MAPIIAKAAVRIANAPPFPHVVTGRTTPELASNLSREGLCAPASPGMYAPERHHRRSIRLPGFDYTSPGGYFVTICTQGRVCRLGEIREGVVELSPCGLIVRDEWLRLPTHFPHLELDEFVVMPNHVHGVVFLTEVVSTKPAMDVESGRAHGTVPGSLAAILQSFKSVSSRRVRRLTESQEGGLWQRGYYERVIRSEREGNAIRDYIRDNPRHWADDVENIDHQ